MDEPKRKSSVSVVSDNVLALRKREGLSQEGLAGRAGMSRATVAALELERYQSVELSTLEALADALGVDEAHLLARPAELDGPLQAFRDSPWFAAIDPIESELLWLAASPASFWAGMKPTPRLIAELIELRRRNLTKQ